MMIWLENLLSKYRFHWQQMNPASSLSLYLIQNVYKMVCLVQLEIQWNLSVTTTSKIKFTTGDLFSNVF